MKVLYVIRKINKYCNRSCKEYCNKHAKKKDLIYYTLNKYMKIGSLFI